MDLICFAPSLLVSEYTERIGRSARLVFSCRVKLVTCWLVSWIQTHASPGQASGAPPGGIPSAQAAACLQQQALSSPLCLPGGVASWLLPSVGITLLFPPRRPLTFLTKGHYSDPWFSSPLAPSPVCCSFVTNGKEVRSLLERLGCQSLCPCVPRV